MSEQKAEAETQGPGEPGRRDHLLFRLLQARLLLSSYAALNFILFVRVNPLAPKLICLALGIVGVVEGYRLSHLAGDRDFQPVEFSGVRDSGAEVAAYVATYLLPLIAAPNPSDCDLIAYGIFGLVVVLISLNSTLLQVNPTLYVFGWKIVTVTRENGREQYLMCREVPTLNTPVYVTRHLGALYAEDRYGQKSR